MAIKEKGKDSDTKEVELEEFSINMNLINMNTQDTKVTISSDDLDTEQNDSFQYYEEKDEE